MTLQTMRGNDLAKYMRTERMHNGRFTIDWVRVRREVVAGIRSWWAELVRPKPEKYLGITAEGYEREVREMKYLKDFCALIAIGGLVVNVIIWGPVIASMRM